MIARCRMKLGMFSFGERNVFSFLLFCSLIRTKARRVSTGRWFLSVSRQTLAYRTKRECYPIVPGAVRLRVRSLFNMVMIATRNWIFYWHKTVFIHLFLFRNPKIVNWKSKNIQNDFRKRLIAPVLKHFHYPSIFPLCTNKLRSTAAAMFVL